MISVPEFLVYLKPAPNIRSVPVLALCGFLLQTTDLSAIIKGIDSGRSCGKNSRKNHKLVRIL